MEKDRRQTLDELLKTASVRRGYGAHVRVISYYEAIEQLERELLKVLRGTGVSKTGWKFNPTEPNFAWALRSPTGGIGEIIGIQAGPIPSRPAASREDAAQEPQSASALSTTSGGRRRRKCWCPSHAEALKARARREKESLYPRLEDFAFRGPIPCAVPPSPLFSAIKVTRTTLRTGSSTPATRKYSA